MPPYFIVIVMIRFDLLNWLLRFVQPFNVVQGLGALFGSGSGAVGASVGSKIAAGTMVQAGVSGTMGIFGNIAAKRQQKRNFEFQEKMYNQQVQDARENFRLENERQDWLLRNQKRLEIESMRNAGLNPAWTDSSGSVAPVANLASGTPSGGASASPVGLSGFPNLPESIALANQSDADIDLKHAQAEKLRASAKKDEADTNYVDLESNFLRSTQDATIDFTNSEHRKQLAINDYMKEHPDTYEAVATAQNVINDNFKKGMKKIDAEMTLFRAQVSKMSKEEALLQQQAILTEIQQMFTTEQIDVLQDKNFRDNINNANWLLNEMNSIIDDPTIDGETAKAKLSIYGKAYDEISSKQHQLREQEYGQRQHDDRMQLGYANLAVHGVQGLMEELQWTIDRNDRNNWKKSDYDQKQQHHEQRMEYKEKVRQDRKSNQIKKMARSGRFR